MRKIQILNIGRKFRIKKSDQNRIKYDINAVCICGDLKFVASTHGLGVNFKIERLKDSFLQYGPEKYPNSNSSRTNIKSEEIYFPLVSITSGIVMNFVFLV